MRSFDSVSLPSLHLGTVGTNLTMGMRISHSVLVLVPLKDV